MTRRMGDIACIGAILLSTSSCSGLWSTGSMQPYTSLYGATGKDDLAKSCLDSAYDQADRAHANRATDMGMIAVAALFGAAGLGMTTASTFISDTENGGQPSSKRQWIAGAGSVSVGVSAALLALRTALNLGELSSAQVTSATTQAALASQIVKATSEKRETLYEQCIELSSKPNAAYPGAVQSNSPTTSPPNPPSPSSTPSSSANPVPATLPAR